MNTLFTNTEWRILKGAQ